jgi:5-bromo-4-chloroindolyl phosphate hydrolysis protein
MTHKEKEEKYAKDSVTLEQKLLTTMGNLVSDMASGRKAPLEANREIRTFMKSELTEEELAELRSNNQGLAIVNRVKGYAETLIQAFQYGLVP